MATIITIIVKERADRSGLFEVREEGRHHLLCTSRQPFFDSARKLARIALIDPEAILCMKHQGSDVVALHGRLSVAAGLTVVERNKGRIQIERWVPSQAAEGLE